MDFISAIVLVLVSVFTILYGYFKYSFDYWRRRHVLCDKPSIPYGNIRGYGKTIHPAHLLKNYYDKLKPMGQKLYGIYYFCRPNVILIDLDLIKNVLVKDFANFHDRAVYYNEVDDPLSLNLFSMEGEKWKKTRSKITPTFSSLKTKHMFPIMVDIGKRFRECLSEVVQKHEDLEMNGLLARFTTDVIGQCALGIECNSLKNPKAEFRRYGGSIYSNTRHSPLCLAWLREIRGIARKLHVKRYNDVVGSFFMKVIRETVEYREQNNVNRNDIKDLLIKLKNQETTDNGKTVTFNESATESLLSFIAASETTSSTLAFCFYELAQNLDIQTKARSAIREAIEKHNGQFTYETMMDMPYIDKVIEETIRKYPAVPTISRTTTSDYRVPGTNITLEKGVDIFIPIYAIQHDPEYFPDPEKYDPDRFETKERNPMSWLPFGDGPRNCIGARFAMILTRIGLVTLLNDFEFELSSKTPVPIDVHVQAFELLPRNGLYLKLKSLNS